MIEIEKPKIEQIELTEDYGRFVIEPLERGYGITLGNSLRRVLLSSLPGTAVTSVKIDGVLHEFSTLSGVVEDTVDIVLNLKKLLVKLYTDEPVVVRIEAKGAGPIYARDIIADASVEILNPDLYIATLQEDGSLNMEITVAKGRGYVPAERNKLPEHPIGIIPVDSIFTPVSKVNFQIDNTRVGQVTDYDKLTIDIWTDKTIAPDEALGLASKILIEHLKLFTDLTDSSDEVEIMVEKEEEAIDRLLEMTIEELDLSVRSYNCLKRAGINTLEECRRTKKQ